MILVGDVGGTNTRLALAMADGPSFRLEGQRIFATHGDIGQLIAEYLAARDGLRPAAVALCGAGPLLPDGSIRLTNADCHLRPERLGAAAGTPHVVVVNDFEAVAHALPALTPADLLQCGGGTPLPLAPRVALGPGTGLGIAGLVHADGAWLAVPGEGGHVDLAPVDDDELAVWQLMRQRHGRVSAEMVLSGHGLTRLYQALGGDGIEGPAVAAAAAAGDAKALAVERLFTRWLGRVAGNAALSFAARGGVYIAGGIVPAWGTRFDVPAFRGGFEDKAPFVAMLAQIPTFVIMHPQPALLGLARLAAARLQAQ
jgi:glucokinase